MRVKLSEQYPKEREDICNRLLTILDLKEDNTFLLCDLDEDILKQEKILAMKEEIPKYFAVSSIATFKPCNESTKRDYLNIIRGILRQQGYSFVSSEKSIKDENGVFKKIRKYYVFRN